MGAEQSAQAKALKDVAKLTSTKVPQWRETLDKFNDLVAQAYRADPTKLMLECKEKKVADVLVRLLREVLSAVAAPNVPPAKDVVAILAALRTVLTSKSIFKLVPRTDLEPVTQALSRFSQLPHTRRSADVEVLGLQVLRVAVERLFETDQPKYDKSEKTNKDHLVRIGLLDLLKQLYQLYTASATQHPAPLVELLSVFESFLTSHPHTTDFAVMQSLLEFLQESRDSLLELTRHPHPEVRPLACRLLQGAMLRMSVAEAVALQEHARKDGALLWQLALAVADADQQMRVARTFLAGTVPPPGEPGFAASGPALADVRIAMPGLSPASPATQSPHQRAPMVARQSSRHLLHLLCSRNEASMAVIKRVVPARLFVALNEPKRAEAAGAAPSSPFHPPAQDVVAANRDQRHRQSLTVQQQWFTPATEAGDRCNWTAFFAVLDQDWESAELLWTEETRAELVDALVRETEELDALRRAAKQRVAWDWEGFEVEYPSYRREVFIGDYNLRLLVPALAQRELLVTISDPADLRRRLHDQCVVARTDACRRASLIALRLLQSHRDLQAQLGEFPGVPLLVSLLERDTTSAQCRDEVLALLQVLFAHKVHVQRFVAAGGLDVLVPLMYLPRTEEQTGTEGEGEGAEAADTDASAADAESGEAADAADAATDASASSRPAALAAVSALASRPNASVFPAREVAVVEAAAAGSAAVLNGAAAPALDAEGVALAVLQLLAAAVKVVRRLAARLARPMYTRALVQLLLFTDSPAVVRDVLRMLSVLLPAASTTPSQLTVSAVLTYLLARPEVERGMDAHTAKFVATYHAHHDGAPAGGSATERSLLRSLLPEQLITLLVTDGPDTFATAFSAECAAYADLMWEASMRSHLVATLRKHVAPLRAQLRADPSAVLRDASMPQVAYTQLQDQPSVAGVYLKPFVQGAPTRKRLDKEAFGGALAAELLRTAQALVSADRRAKRPSSAALASATAAEASAEESSDAAAEAAAAEAAAAAPTDAAAPNTISAAEQEAHAELLLRCLFRLLVLDGGQGGFPGDALQAITLLCERDLLHERARHLAVMALEVLNEALQPSAMGVPNSGRCSQFIDRGGVPSMALVLERAAQGSFMSMLVDAAKREAEEGAPAPAAATAATGAAADPAASPSLAAGAEPVLSESASPVAFMMRVLTIVSLLGRVTRGQTVFSERPVLVQHLLAYCRLRLASQAPRVAVPAIECVVSLCKAPSLYSTIVGAGGLVFLLQTALAYDTAAVAKAVGPAAAASVPKAASRALRALAGLLHQDVVGEPQVVALLKQLLTPGLYKALGRGKLLTLALAPRDIRHPALIWTRDMRTTLLQLLEHEAAKVDRCMADTSLHADAADGRVWSPEALVAVDGFLYQYPALRREVIVADLYLRLFNHSARHPTSPGAEGDDVAAALAQLQDLQPDALATRVLEAAAAAHRAACEERASAAPAASAATGAAAGTAAADATDSAVTPTPSSEAEEGSSEDEVLEGECTAAGRPLRRLLVLLTTLRHLLDRHPALREQVAKAGAAAQVARALEQPRVNAAITGCLAEAAQGVVPRPSLDVPAVALVACALRVLQQLASLQAAQQVLASVLLRLHELLLAAPAFGPGSAMLLLQLMLAAAKAPPDSGPTRVAAVAVHSGLVLTLAAGVLSGAAEAELAARCLGAFARRDAAAAGPVPGPRRKPANELDVVFSDAVADLFAPMFTTQGRRRGVLLEAEERPAVLIECVRDSIEEPELLWNADMRRDLTAFLRAELALVRERTGDAIQHGAQEPWPRYSANTLRERYARPALDGELCVAGIFIRLFVRSAYTKLDALHFLRELFVALGHEFVAYRGEAEEAATSGAASGATADGAEAEAAAADAPRALRVSSTGATSAREDRLVLLWRAVHVLLKENVQLADKNVCIEHMTFLVHNFEPGVHTEVQAAALAVLEQLACVQPCVDTFTHDVEANTGDFLLLYLMRLFTALRNEAHLARALNVITALCRRSSQLVQAFSRAGMVLVLVDLLLTPPRASSTEASPVATAAAHALKAMSIDDMAGAAVVECLARLLTPRFVSVLAKDVEGLAAFALKEHDYTPKASSPHVAVARSWTDESRVRVHDAVKEAVATLQAMDRRAWDGKSNRWDASLFEQAWPGEAAAATAAAAAADTPVADASDAAATPLAAKEVPVSSHDEVSSDAPATAAAAAPTDSAAPTPGAGADEATGENFADATLTL